MRRLDFLHALSRDYDKIDDNILEIKSGVIGLCADIQRFFRLHFAIDLTDKTSIVVNDEFCRVFPCLAGMNTLQLKQLADVFCKIKKVNSYLFLSRPIKIPDALQAYFATLPAPQYDITLDGELTSYGMVYVLAILSQKQQIGAFVIDYLGLVKLSYTFYFS